MQFMEKDRCSQANIQGNQRDIAAGQAVLVRLSIFLLVTLIVMVFGAITGFQGGGIVLHIAVGTSYRYEFVLVALVIGVLLFLTVYWSWNKSLFLTLLVSVLLTTFFKLLALFGILEIDADFLFSVISNLVIQLAICISALLGIRFLLALLEIIFLRSLWCKITIIFFSLLAVHFGAKTVFLASIQQENSPVKRVLEALNEPDYFKLEAIAFIGGIGLFYSIAIAGWLNNRLRRTPWRYPDLIRDWVLAVGSWGGTSFYNLDLSNVNFAVAKLANTDLRANKLYRTCFQGAIGLERARVDNQYLDLAYPKVQKLLTHACSSDLNFRKFNLQGAYLQNADMRGFDLTDANLTGADLKGADLRQSTLIRTQLAEVDLQGVDLRKNILIDANLTEANLSEADLRDCILVRAQVARADFTGADLTGACIEDWSISSKTKFTDVRCDYIFRRYQDGEPIDRYPIDRNFEPGEFASLYAEPEDVVELVFKGEFNIAALSLALYKLQTNAPELHLELRGVEQRENLWVAKIKSTRESLNASLIEERLALVYQNAVGGSIVEETVQTSIYREYEENKRQLAEKEQVIQHLIETAGSQAIALKELSQRSTGNTYNITDSTVENLVGEGQIQHYGNPKKETNRDRRTEA